MDEVSLESGLLAIYPPAAETEAQAQQNFLRLMSAGRPPIANAVGDGGRPAESAESAESAGSESAGDADEAERAESERGESVDISATTEADSSGPAPMAVSGRARADSLPLEILGNIAIVRIQGMMRRHLSDRERILQAWFGLTPAPTTAQYEASVRSAIADKRVDTLLTIGRTPGGYTSFVPELCDAVWEAREAGMKTVFFCDEMTASAGLWVASQHEHIVASRSALLGSLGTFGRVVDSSKAFEMAGYRIDIVSSAELKGARQPGVPVSQAALDDYQQLILSINDVLIGDVARGRGLSVDQVQGAWGDARCYIGQAAVDIGMADSVDTLRNTVSSLLTAKVEARGDGRPSAAAASDTGADAQPERDPKAQILVADADGAEHLAELHELRQPGPAGATHWIQHPSSSEPVYLRVEAVDMLQHETRNADRLEAEAGIIQ